MKNDGLPYKRRSLGTDAIFQYSGSITRALSGLLFYVVVDRLFDTTLVGAIALLIAITGLLSGLFSLGLGPASQHFISAAIGKGDKGSARRIIMKIFTLSTIASLAGSALLVIFSVQISNILFHGPSYAIYVSYTAIVLFATNLFVVFNGILLGLQKFRESAIITVITWALFYSVAVVLALVIRSLFEIVIGWILGMAIGSLVEYLLIARSTNKMPRKGTLPDNRIFYGFLLPVLFSSLMGYGSIYTDRFIVAGLLSLSQLGIYNFVLLFALSMLLISAPFSNILIPKFSELFGKGEKGEIKGYVRGSVLLLSFVYVPIALGIAAISPLLLHILGGSQYVAGTAPLMIIMFISALFSPQYILTQAMVSVRKTNVLLVSNSVPLLSNILLSFLLIPKFGLIGAALGFSSVNVATFIILLYYSNKEELASFEILGMMKVWAASLATFALMYILRSITGNQIGLVILYIIAGVLVYLGIVRGLRIFTGHSREIVSSLFPSTNAVNRIFTAVLNVR